MAIIASHKPKRSRAETCKLIADKYAALQLPSRYNKLLSRGQVILTAFEITYTKASYVDENRQIDAATVGDQADDYRALRIRIGIADEALHDLRDGGLGQSAIDLEHNIDLGYTLKRTASAEADEIERLDILLHMLERGKGVSQRITQLESALDAMQKWDADVRGIIAEISHSG